MIFPLVPQVRVRTPWALAAFAAVVARSLRGPEASLNSIAIIVLAPIIAWIWVKPRVT